MVLIIENPRQYEATRVQVERLQTALLALPTDPASRPNVAPELQQLERDTIQDLIDELRDQMTEYEALVDGTRTGRGVPTLEELPRLLVDARDAADLSVRDLAERIGLSEAELMGFERSNYSSASYSLILRIAETLGVRVRGHIDLTFPVSSTVLERVRSELKQTLQPSSRAMTVRHD